MKNMVDYYDHYLKNDMLLLVDVFEKFSRESLKFYKLDPSNYLSFPGLSYVKNDWNKIRTNFRQRQAFIY